MRDVVIIGAGIIGSSIALELQMRSIATVLIERGEPGKEASSAAAGMLAPQLEADAADPVFELGLYSRGLYPAYLEVIRKLSGLDAGYSADGALQLMETEEEMRAELDRFTWQKDRGLRLEALSTAEVKAHIPGVREDIGGALFFPDDAQVDPRLLMRAISMATTRAGVQHVNGTPVRRVVVKNGRVLGVELEDQVIAADKVIIAAGAWSSLIEGAAPKGSIHPVRGQILALDCDRPPCLPLVACDFGYLVPRRDGRVLVGSTIEQTGYEKAVTAGAIQILLSAALDTIPSLAEARIGETWSGLRPCSIDERPILGPGSVEGLYFATGHYRNGILQAPATAALIADLIEEKAPALELAPYSVKRFF